jgi:hypothetical protein
VIVPLTRRALLAGLAGLAAGALVQACGALSRPGPSGGLTSQSDAAAFGTPTPPEFDEPGQAEMVATIVAQQAVTTAVPSYAVFTPVAAPRRAAARVQRGISVLSWRVGQFSSPDADATLEKLAALGTQWIAVIVNGYQDAIASTAISWGTAPGATEADLIHVIGTAHRLGLRVMLKPHVDLGDDSTRWRGQIGTTFTDAQRREWFANYRLALVRMAGLAQFHQVEQLCVGTELEGLSGFAAEWRALVAALRAVYRGKLTYASNHDGEEARIAWWDALDLIGVDAYYSLVDQDTPTVDELKRAWSDLGYVRLLQGMHARFGKPVVFTEIGYRSIDAAAFRPWEWDRKAPINLTAQAHAYRAAIETFSPLDWFGGFFWWSWDAAPTSRGPADDGYTPDNKPAEYVLRRYYRRQATT